MHPMRLITYAVLTSIVSLVAMGGIGFYAGYSAGRGDLEEMKTVIAAGGSPEAAQALIAAVREQAGISAPAAPAPEVDLEPLLAEIRSMSTQLGTLERQVAQQPRTAESAAENEDPATVAELSNVKELLVETNSQYQTCRQNLTSLQSQFEELKTSTQVSLRQSNARQSGGSVVLFDNVLLTRNENKLYRDVDVSLSLQSMDSRSARVAVNRKPVGISFGERKIFVHRDVTCELVLMETDLEGGQARVSIACKR
ncbi:MAG: hypothetical protein KTR19_01065 [Hyphomicrobiales bacterium]|nr:hypothetical protein [Hyphomicrobiales bacterium]